MSEVLKYSSLLDKKKKKKVKRSYECLKILDGVEITKKRKRIGRGHSAGQGKTCGRGHKGQKARSGYSHRSGFEGGQTPLHRRLPKRGFHNPFSKKYQIVNLDSLEKIKGVSEWTPEVMKEKGLIRDVQKSVKILGRGEWKEATKFVADSFSKQVIQKLESSGSTCEIRKKTPKNSKAPKKEIVKNPSK